MDNYKDGKVRDHEGSWRAGEQGARHGVLMPGKLSRGTHFVQEIAPGEAMDRARVLSLVAPGGEQT